jgi:hypothetical protein
MLAEAIAIPPVYAPARPSDASLAEGWRIAYEMERERRILGDRRIASVSWIADHMLLEDNVSKQYGAAIKQQLVKTIEELDEQENAD